ncbi:MAG TPA: ABC-2 transporter permease [Candidatus Intestinimonas pullistercoris]|uniref:ABC-2 transporter permease n=1 Tax=Candidatus Intestinimonas pullistercoris TaxID=2838623 RepID=A0A9D2P0E9_9FIRM|nr:ABC-2 transporter permease [uncultured Intestinimonas sp.]HJC40359.1 ABC-2 transporter permease [Candidatus Intestinimonas pullistercoris]
MMGLVKKDFYLAAGLARSYLIVAAIFLVLSLAGIYEFSFLSSFMSLLCIMLPVNVFSYDEQAKWDKYAAALPGGRRAVVQARYVFTLIVSAGAVVLGGAVGAAACLLDPTAGETLWEMVLSTAAGGSVGILLNAVMLPLMFKFGVQKGRLYLALVLAILFGAFLGGVAALASAVQEPSVLILPLAAIPAAGLLALVPSYFLSLRIFRKKDL